MNHRHRLDHELRGEASPKITKSLLSLFTEGEMARVLKEEDDSAAHQSDESGQSIDAQVDRYLAQYEGDAKKADEPSVEQMEALDWRDLVKGQVITEAGEGDKDEEAGPEDAAPGADALTGTDTSKLGLDKLDVEKFANDVVRLIQNYESLLEVQNTLLRRATNFLEKTYDPDVVKAFQDTLRDDHGMEAGKDSSDVNSEKFPAPPAERAQGSAEPGAGGTGAPA